MKNIFQLAYLVPLFLLLGFLINGLGRKVLSKSLISIIGSGTVGTGCFLELNGTGKLDNPDYQEQWLKDGDVVEMEIEQLGMLSNTILAEETDWSILKLKK